MSANYKLNQIMAGQLAGKVKVRLNYWDADWYFIPTSPSSNGDGWHGIDEKGRTTFWYADDNAWRVVEEPQTLTNQFVGSGYLQPMKLDWIPSPKATTQTCTCDIKLIMREGCKCGGFAAEQLAKVGG